MVEIPGEIRGIRAVPEIGVMCDIGMDFACKDRSVLLDFVFLDFEMDFLSTKNNF